MQIKEKGNAKLPEIQAIVINSRLNEHYFILSSSRERLRVRVIDVRKLNFSASFSFWEGHFHPEPNDSPQDTVIWARPVGILSVHMVLKAIAGVRVVYLCI